MLGLAPDQFGGVEISLKDPGSAEEVKTGLQKIFAGSYKVQTRYEQNQSLYSIMRVERWVIYAVLVLLMIVFYSCELTYHACY